MLDHNIDEDRYDPGEEDHKKLFAANTTVAVGRIGLLEQDLFIFMLHVVIITCITFLKVAMICIEMVKNGTSTRMSRLVNTSLQTSAEKIKL